MSTSQHIFTGRGTPPLGPSPVRRYFHCESGGWVYRNHKDRSLEIRIGTDGRILDEVTRIVAYLLSHAALEFGPVKAKHLYRRFGICSSRRLKVCRGVLVCRLFEKSLSLFYAVRYVVCSLFVVRRLMMVSHLFLRLSRILLTLIARGSIIDLR
jgi:hypothetical protein